ncbi:unnamed protein product [Effrenium voratum]|uniref:Uncharacterized protein n=1 Tax=Effrenium voratum TaxID=2562239 RepID=A0AA36MTM1_9DINO|nr:unnamed protein product [Effrenium voratum]CAJ1425057.1 unnamed protein product [Effrenium voratum]CAJ1438502.1 unnamed protein product [Effrenium voratum]
MALLQRHGARTLRQGCRWYTPPSRRTWSKQHHRIRMPRPMVDRFDLSRVQPQKEWWRERRIAPATFFGFPDVTKAGLRGGSMYVEQMDAVTLAVLTDKCVQEDVWDPEVWMKFCWRAQQLSSRTQEPDLCYIFRAFARADWFDQNLLTTYLGRLHRRLPMFQLPDVTVLLEAFANPRFRQGEYLQRSLTHMALLLQHRDDASVEDLAKTSMALRDLLPQPEELAVEVRAGLQLLAEALLLRELSDLSPTQAIHVMHSMASWGLVNSEHAQSSNAPADLCWTLARELKGKIREAGRASAEDLAALAMAMNLGAVRHEEVWQELAKNLELEMHRLSGSGVATAVYAASRFGHRNVKFYENALRRLGEEAPKMSPLDCARAAGGFLRPGIVAEKALKGALGDQILHLGFGAFDTEALSLMLDALSRARAGVWGVEAMAGSVLEEIHSRLSDFAAEELASISRSLGYLQPEVSEVLREILDRTAQAVQEEGVSPRCLAMLCQGIALQPPSALPDASERLEALLPQVHEALKAKPTAVSAAQIFWSLSRCSCPARDEVLQAADECLAARAVDLSADLLVNLAESMAAVGRTGWQPSRKLVARVSSLLDMKRYDLRPGKLWRAAVAFQSLEVPEEYVPQLEPRDRPDPKTRQKDAPE